MSDEAHALLASAKETSMSSVLVHSAGGASKTSLDSFEDA